VRGGASVAQPTASSSLFPFPRQKQQQRQPTTANFCTASKLPSARDQGKFHPNPPPATQSSFCRRDFVMHVSLNPHNIPLYCV
jgi:hypothetical protein